MKTINIQIQAAEATMRLSDALKGNSPSLSTKNITVCKTGFFHLSQELMTDSLVKFEQNIHTTKAKSFLRDMAGFLICI